MPTLHCFQVSHGRRDSWACVSIGLSPVRLGQPGQRGGISGDSAVPVLLVAALGNRLIALCTNPLLP
jgi:hypothetical protein